MGNANKFYMVAPFLVPLKKWIAEQRRSSLSKAEAPKDIAAELGTETIGNVRVSEVDTAAKAPTELAVISREINNAHSAQNSIEKSLEDASAQLKRLLSVHKSPIPAPAAPLNPGQTAQSNLEGSNALLALLRNRAPQNKEQHQQDIPPLNSLSAASQAIPLASKEAQAKVPFPIPFSNVSSHTVSNSSENALHLHQLGTQPPSQQILGIPIRFDANLTSLQHPHGSTTANKLGFSQLPHSTQSPSNGSVIQMRPDLQVHPTPYSLQQSGQTPMSSQMPQFKTVHDSVIPSASQLPPPKLTTHSLNLLNVLKNGQVSKMVAQPGVAEASDSYKTHIEKTIADGKGSTKTDSLPPQQTNLIPTLTSPHQPTPLPTPSSQLQFDRRRGQPADQKKALLSLFSKPSPEATVTAPHAPISSARIDEKLSAVRADILSQVSSKQGMRSDSNTRHDIIHTATPSPTRTPKSAADREFLLGYLKGVAKG